MAYTYSETTISRHVLIFEAGQLLGTFFVWCDGMDGEEHERYFVEIGGKWVYLDTLEKAD